MLVFARWLVVWLLPIAQALAQGDPILIGQSAPLSGSNRELGEEIRDGALAYFKRVNDAGGLGGRRLELVSLDDANGR